MGKGSLVTLKSRYRGLRDPMFRTEHEKNVNVFPMQDTRVQKGRGLAEATPRSLSVLIQCEV